MVLFPIIRGTECQWRCLRLKLWIIFFMSRLRKITALLLVVCFGTLSFQSADALCQTTSSVDQQSCCCAPETGTCVSAPTLVNAGCDCTISSTPADSEYPFSTASTPSPRDDNPQKNSTGYVAESGGKSVTSPSAVGLTRTDGHSPSFGSIKLQHLFQSYLI